MNRHVRIVTMGLLVMALFAACSEDSNNPINTANSRDGSTLQKQSDRYLVEYSNEN